MKEKIDLIKYKYFPVISIITVFSIVFAGNNDINYSVIVDKQIGLSITLLFLNFVSFFPVASNKLWSIKITHLDLFILLLCLYIVAQYLFFSGTPSANYYSLALLVILYFNLRVLISVNKSIWFIIVIIFCLILLGELMIGILQYIGILRSFHHLFKMTGTFFNPGPFSNFIAILCPVYIYYLIPTKRLLKICYYRSKAPILKILFFLMLFSVIGSIAILPLTMGRSAWLGVVISLCILCCRETKLLFQIKTFFKRKKLLFGSAVFLAIVILVVTIQFLYQLKSDSAEGRILIWKLSFEIFVHNPIFGVGFGNFKGTYADLQAEYFTHFPHSNMAHVAGSPDFAFNDYLQILAEGGIIGASLFVVICILIFRSLLRSKNGIIYAAFSLFIISFTSYPLNVLPIGMLSVFIAAFSQRLEKGYNVFQKRYCFTFFFIGLFVSANAYVFLQNKRKALNEWTLYQSSYRNNAFRSVIYVYDKIYDRLTDEVIFILEYSTCLVQTKHYEKSIKILNHHKNIINDPLYYLILAKAYEGLGQKDMAVCNYKKAITHSPSRIEGLFHISQFYTNEGEYLKSDSIINVALNKKLKINDAAKKRWHQKLINLQNRNNKLNCKHSVNHVANFVN